MFHHHSTEQNMYNVEKMCAVDTQTSIDIDFKIKKPSSGPQNAFLTSTRHAALLR
jgi:hypothetical protein